MDLLSIGQMVWRRKLLTIPILLLTCLAGLYMVKVKHPTYEATSSVILTNPPTKATAAQIAADPSLKNANSYNQFTQYGDLQVVASAVMDLVSSPSSQPALLAAGVIPNYQLALSTDPGDPPIIDITGVGTTPEAAINSANVLTQAVKNDLIQMQLKQGVNPFYLITADNYVLPTRAQTSSSGKTRSLVVVLAAGLIILLISISTADAIEKRRKGGRRGREVQQRGDIKSRRTEWAPALDSENATSSPLPSYRVDDDPAWPNESSHSASYPPDYPTAQRYPRR